MSETKTVKIERIKVAGVENGDFAEARQRWMHLADTMRRVTNDLRMLWFSEHFAASNHIAVRNWMRADTTWAQTPKGERGKRQYCPVRCWPAEIVKTVYAKLRHLHPFVHTRCVTLALNTEQKSMKTAKAKRSAYPRWMKTLAGDGEFPSSSGPLPILFDKKNGRLNYREKENFWTFRLYIDRLPSGNGKPAKSTEDVLRLKTGGRRLRKLRNTLELIAAGAWEFKGSRLAYQRDGWYLLLCYQMPSQEKPQLDRDKTAYLSPAVDRPVHLWVDTKHIEVPRKQNTGGPLTLLVGGFPLYLGRHGRDVEHLRRSLLVQRWARQESYRYASSARKGHGSKKAVEKLKKLSLRWRDFVKGYNERLAADVVKQMVNSGTGRLVYFQPEGRRAERRFLATAGKVPERRDSTGWDWFQLKTLLARRCQEAGIAFVCHKLGAKPAGAKGNGRPSGEHR